MKVTAADRKAFLELMNEVRGPNFMLGWLESSFVNPNPQDIEDAVLLGTREQLLADKLAGNVYVGSNLV